jgi:hypothetical protein
MNRARRWIGGTCQFELINERREPGLATLCQALRKYYCTTRKFRRTVSSKNGTILSAELVDG